MTTQYTPILKLALPVTGELSGTWGTVVNDNITSMVEQAVAGLSTINTWTANAHTLTTADGTSSEARCAMLVLATGSGGTALTGAGEVICPAASKMYVVKNGTSFAVTLKTSSGTGVAVPAGDTAFLFCDGTNVNACVTTIVNGHISGNLTVDGNTTLGDATSDTITATARFNTDLLPSTDNARDLGSTANSWRTLYCDTSVLTPLVTATNLQVTNIKANDGTAVAVLTDSTGALDISKAVTFSATTQNISLGASQTTGTFVLGGTAATGAITLDASTKTHTLGVGSGATESGATKTINIGTGGVSGSTTTITIGSSNGTTTTFNGTVNVTTLDLTNLEVTNIKAKDGTAAITLADSTGVATFSANPILNAGTANGVVYLNASKVATTGSALTFDGTTLVNANGSVQVPSTATFKFGAGFTNYIQGDTTNNFLAFATNSSEQMRLNSSGLEVKQSQLIGYSSFAGIGSNGLAVLGNVGIGTSSPAGKLHVTGVAYFGNTGASDTQLRLGPLDASNAYFQSVSADGATGKGMIFYVGSTSMTLNSSGNLGLGVTPSASTSFFKTLQIGTDAAKYSLFGQRVGGNAETFVGWNAYGGSNTSTAGTGFYYVNSSDLACMYSQTSGVHAWYNAPTGTAGNLITFTQAMTLDASGNLGVGTTSALSRIDARAASATMGNYQTIQAFSTDTSAAIDLGGGISLGGFYNSTQIAQYASIVGRKANGTAGNYDGYLAFGTNAQATGVVERARITSGGDLLVGTQTNLGGGKLDVYSTTRVAGFTTNSSSGSQDAVNISNQSNTAYQAIRFFVNGAPDVGSVIGSISCTTTATAYNTSSDYRLKDNIAPMAGALAKVAALKPVTYSWKSDGSDGEGFIAHELAEVVPQCVTGKKDAVDAEGKPIYQGIDTSFLVATLTAAIQEQQAMINELKAEVAALKGA